MEEIKNAKLRKHKISLYWLVPIVALIITVLLIWENSFNKGPLVSLHMDDASGIEAGKTVVKFRSVDVGVVESVSLSKDFSGAVAKIRMYSDTDELLNEDSLFWIVKPRIQSHSITGLETILSGSYIQIYKGKSDKNSTEFVCLKDIPLGLDEHGIPIKLFGHTTGVIPNGTQINYKGFNIGIVVSSTYDIAKDDVVYNALIKKSYSQLVNSNSVFWVDSGVDFSLTPSGVNFSIPNLENIISGSINVNQFISEKGDPIKPNDSFDVYKDKVTAKYENLKDNPKFVVLIDNDIKNIKVGSKVNFRGLDIGQVIKMPWYENDSEVFDYKNKIPALIVLDTDKESSLTAKRVFSKNLENKTLCAQIDNASLIAPGNVIKLTIDPNNKCRSKKSVYRDIAVIPLVKKTDMVNELQLFAKKLNSLDLNAVTNNLNSSLVSLNSTLKSVKGVTDSVNKNHTLENLNKVLNSYNQNSELYKSLLEISNKLNQSLNELNPTIKKVGQKSNSLVFSSENKDIEPKVSKR